MHTLFSLNQKALDEVNAKKSPVGKRHWTWPIFKNNYNWTTHFALQLNFDLNSRKYSILHDPSNGYIMKRDLAM